jgi:23S rRNA pseudouridine1911/1915/1917 synthase
VSDKTNAGTVRRQGPRVLYEDNHCVAVFKPAGLLTIGDRTGDRALVDFVRDDLRQRYRKLGNVYVGVVHRLDRPVAGVVLFARTSKAAGRLAEQFRRGGVRKVYQALVEGRVATAEGDLVDRLVKDRRTNIVRRTTKPGPQSRECALRFRRLKVLGDTTLLEIEPRTGRSHQIRVQLAAAGHPIVGDRKYGSTRAFSDGIALRAVRLVFEHPVRRVPVTVEAAADWSGGTLPEVSRRRISAQPGPRHGRRDAPGTTQARAKKLE